MMKESQSQSSIMINELSIIPEEFLIDCKKRIINQSVMMNESQSQSTNMINESSMSSENLLIDNEQNE